MALMIWMSTGAGAATNRASSCVMGALPDILMTAELHRSPLHWACVPPRIAELVAKITAGTPLYMVSLLDELAGRGMLAEPDEPYGVTHALIHSRGASRSRRTSARSRSHARSASLRSCTRRSRSSAITT